MSETVPREVALRACEMVAFIVKMRAEGGNFQSLDHLWEEYGEGRHIISPRRFSPGPDTTPLVDLIFAAVARAEQEHAERQAALESRLAKEKPDA